MNDSNVVDSGAAAALAARCLDHLRVEEMFRARAVAVLHAVQQALSVGRWSALADLAPVQEQLGQESEQLGSARRRLCAEASAVLGVPAEELTLEQIARRLPEPDRARVLEQRGALRAGARETHRLAQVCSVVARYHLDFIQRFFAELTGRADGACYGPEGTLQPSACRSLLQARG